MRQRNTLCLLLLTGLLFYLVRCKETLPPRIMPQSVLEVAGVNYMQGMGKDGLPYIAFVITIRNTYSEIFQEKVNITGNMTIGMRGHPEVRATIEICNGDIAAPSNFIGNTLTIEPGGKCFLQMYWFLYFDDGKYLPQVIAGNSAMLVMEAEFRIFSQIGYLKTEPLSITYTSAGGATTQRPAAMDWHRD